MVVPAALMAAMPAYTFVLFRVGTTMDVPGVIETFEKPTGSVVAVVVAETFPKLKTARLNRMEAAVFSFMTLGGNYR